MRALGNRALTEIPQHVGVQQNVGASIGIGQETEALAAIEPFHDARNLALLPVVFFHVVLSPV